MSPSPIVEIRGVSKRFGGTQALDVVDVDLRPGEVHALVGENGAGKSTVGKIISGIYVQDSGDVLVAGAPVRHWDTVRAQRAGVVMIAQELSLVPQLSVAQNVLLGVEDHAFGALRRTERARLESLCAEAGFSLPYDARIDDMRIAERQKVEILRALARDAKVIVMDEPTSSLTGHETEQLHALIRRLRDQGKAIVYVSHFLDDVLDIADTVSVMRDGRKVHTGPAAELTKRGVVELMLGRSLEVTFPDRVPDVAASVAPVVTMRGVTTDEGADGVDLEVRPGEIVGLLGLVGSGRTEIARALAGADLRRSGDIAVDGAPVARWSIPQAIAAGVVMVPEDRHKQGLVLERDVNENIALASLRQFATLGVIAGRKERAATSDMADSLSMRPADVRLGIVGLSGGNQQKALIGKWLLAKPRLVVLDEPTRGVDVGAKATIYRLITELAREGVAVLLISSEHEEVLALSTRAHIVSSGTVGEQVDPSTLTVEDLLPKLFAVEEAAS